MTGLRRAVLFALFGAYLFGFCEVVYWSSIQPHHKASIGGGPHQMWEWGHSDPAVAFFTFCLVVVGAVQAGLFLWQLKIMRAGIEDARITAKAAQAAAETAKEQVAVTKMGIVDLERAYLSIGPTEIIVDYIVTSEARARGYYQASDPEELTVHLFVHNTGRTGATLKKIYGLFTDSPPIGDRPLYLPLSDQPTETDLSIAAGAASKLDPFEFKSEFIGAQFFWGYVEYKDIFKNTRVSRFCTRLEPAARGGKGKYQIAGSDAWRECD